jgi:VCBS repeat-containing protein
LDNSPPLIDGASVTGGSVHEPDGGAALDSSAAGVIRFTDADLADLHNAVVTGVAASGVTGGLPGEAALLALLTTDTLAEPAGGEPGSLGWHFTATDEAFDYLAAGEIVTLTYAISIADGQGGEVLQDVTIIVTGSNDAPAIDAASVTGGAVGEADGAGPDSAAGTILFTDADLSDVHGVTVGSVSASGVTAGLPDAAALLALLTTDAVTEPANGESGSLGWHFSAAESAFDYLAAGETVTLTYAVGISDGQGGEALQDVTITVTGSNDAPTVDAASVTAGSVFEPDGGSALDSSTAGAILFTDAELSDAHGATVAGVSAAGVTAGLPDEAALLALLTTDALVEPGNGATGSVGWHFTATDGAFDYLADGETVTLTYAVRIADSVGGETVQDVEITITGRDDAPLVDAGSVTDGTVHEADGSATPDSAAGTILFTDADLSDVHGVTVGSVSVSGVTAGLADETALLALLTTDPLTEPAGGEPGALGWHFTAAEGVFDYLAAGETVTLTYVLTISDGQSGEAVREVRITVTGSNDAPAIDAASVTLGAVFEPDGGAASDSEAAGTILFTDAELADLHGAAIAGVSASGATAGLPGQAALLGLLTMDALMEPAGAEPGSLGWHFTAAGGAFDYLAAGETVTLTYALTIADGRGGETAQDIAVTVTGRDDGPLVDAASVTHGSVHEADGGAASGSQAAGAILFTDPDLADVHAAAIASVGATGVTAGLPDEEVLRALLTMDPAVEPADGHPGSLGWRFAAAEGAFDYLAAGEAVTLTYAVTIADGQGGEAMQDLTITITGSNDAPLIDAASVTKGSVHEPDGTAISGSSTTGTILFTDAEALDAHSIRVTHVGAAGVTAGLPDEAALRALLTTDALAEPAGGQPGSVGWHFDGGAGLFDYLKMGETARLTYTVEISDDHGGVTSRDIVVDAGQVRTSHDYSYSFAKGPAPWTSWMNQALIHDDDPLHPAYTRFTLPGTLDPNHVDGIGPLWLLSHLGSAVAGAAGALDLRGAEIDITLRGVDFDPDGAALYIWICSYLPNGELQNGYYLGLQVTNWAFTGQNLASSVTSDWTTVTVKLDANPADWTYAGNNISGQGDWGYRYAPMGLNEALANVNATLHVVLVGTDPNHPPAGQIDIENISVHTATAATLTPAQKGSPQIVHGLENEAVTGVVNGADASGQAGFHYTLVPDSEHHGSVVLDEQTGAFVFTPDHGYFGLTDTSSAAYFDYVISDGVSGGAPHRVYVFVGPTATTPLAYAGTEDVEIGAGQPYSFYLFKGADASGSTLSFAVDQASVHGGRIEVDARTGKYSFVPDDGFSGAASFAYSVSNGILQSAPKTVTLTVDAPGQSPPAHSYQDVFAHYQANGDDFALARDLNILAGEGDPNAAYNLGLILLSGTRGITVDKAAAAHYFGLSVGTVADASVELARLYISGLGVPRDYAMASTLLHGVEALPIAQYLLGIVAGQGLGMPADAEAAATHYLHAASQGNVDAMYTLGRRYLAGDGVETDPSAAYFWLQVALKYGGGGPALQQFEQLLEYDSGLAAVHLSADDRASVQSAVALWHPGLPTPYETQGDYSIAYEIAGNFLGAAYLSYADTYEFAGVRLKRAYFGADHGEVASETFTFDGGYIIARGGSPIESYSIAGDGSYERRYFITGTFLGHSYQAYANHYDAMGFRDQQTFYAPDGHVVVAQLLAPDGGARVSVEGVLQEQRVMEGDGAYAIHYSTAGTFLGQTYLSYANHYDPSGFRDRQDFYAADGQAAVSQLFTPDGGYSQSIEGVAKEQRVMEAGGGYAIHYFAAGAFLGQSYQSYANHYDSSGFRDQQDFYAADGHAAVSQMFTPDGGYSQSIEGVAKEQRVMGADGGYAIHYFITGAFLGQSYQSYANHYAPSGFRDRQDFYDAGDHVVVSQLLTPDGGYSLGIEGVAKEQRVMEADGGYAIHYFITGTFLGHGYISYANHYDAGGFRDRQTFYDADNHVPVSQLFTPDGGYTVSVQGVTTEQRMMDGDGGYAIHYFITGTFLGHAYLSYANHYGAGGFRDEQNFYASDGHIAVSQLFTPEGGFSVSVEGEVVNSKTMLSDGAYGIYYHHSGLPYSSEDDIYLGSGERVEQTLRYDNGDLRLAIFSPGHEVDIGASVSFQFDDGDYALGTAHSLTIDMGGTRNDIVLHNDGHDLVVAGFAPSAGSRLLAQDLFSDYQDLISHASQQGENVVLDTGDHSVTFVATHLSDLTQATFGFG